MTIMMITPPKMVSFFFFKFFIKLVYFFSLKKIDSDNETPSNSAGGNNNNSKSKRYFWQYNVQAKGPKGQRLVIKTQQEDPHVLNEITDPVFSPNCSVRGIKVNIFCNVSLVVFNSNVCFFQNLA